MRTCGDAGAGTGILVGHVPFLLPNKQCQRVPLGLALLIYFTDFVVPTAVTVFLCVIYLYVSKACCYSATVSFVQLYTK